MAINAIPNGTANGSRSPSTSLHVEMARWLAGRFAAKEAARKAAPGGAASVGWKDVMVTRLEDIDIEADEDAMGGQGEVNYGGFRRRRRSTGRPEIVYLDPNGGPGRFGKLSISHDGEYVVATVLAAS